MPPNRSKKAKTTSIPAPVKGLNARDAIADMEPTFALSLDNWFCTPTSVDTRNGYQTWASGLGGAVETVMHYSSGTANKIFGAANGKIFDVTLGGAVGAASVTGQVSNRWQWVNFTTVGGSFLSMVNGSDSMQLYNGTAWQAVTDISTPIAITGVTTANLIHMNAYKNRLFFVEKNTLNFWYLPINSIGGVANVFPLGSIFTRGGYLMAMATWTIDNTNGVDDYAVFITSEGEVAIYQGTDPSFSSTWTIVGVFRTGAPVGRRCFTKMGSDCVFLCADGVVTFSKELTTDRQQSEALSYNILNLINSDVAGYKNNFGWQPVYHPLGNKLLINVPVMENTQQYQYVMNTITGAWSSWGKLASPLNACCWDIFQDVLYYGGINGKVYQADLDAVLNDDGNAMLTDMKPAFSYFGDLGAEKFFTMVRPIIISTDPVVPTYALNLDYNDVKPQPPSVTTGSGSPWNTSPWNISPWGSTGTQVTKNWFSVGGVAYAASLRMATLTNNIQASLQSIDYVYQTGGTL